MQDLQDFIHQKNLELYRKRLLETADPAERDVLAKLLADEESKDLKPATARDPQRRPTSKSSQD